MFHFAWMPAVSAGEAPALFVYCRAPSHPGHFSDNGFLLLPREERVIVFQSHNVCQAIVLGRIRYIDTVFGLTLGDLTEGNFRNVWPLFFRLYRKCTRHRKKWKDI
jgi:type IV secretory pathway TrbD component